MAKLEKKYQREVGRMLRAARSLSSMTTEDAASVAGVSVATIRNWERGEYAAPPAKLFALCIEYALNGVDPESLAERMDMQGRLADKVTATTGQDKDEVRKLAMLRDMREDAGLTQVQFGQLIGIKRCSVGAVGTAVSEMERGIRYPVDLKNAALKWIDEQGLKYKNSPEIVLPLPPKPKSTIVETIDMQELFNEFVNFITNIAQTERRVK